jgi:hypothetical protein
MLGCGLQCVRLLTFMRGNDNGPRLRSFGPDAARVRPRTVAIPVREIRAELPKEPGREIVANIFAKPTARNGFQAGNELRPEVCYSRGDGREPAGQCRRLYKAWHLSAPRHRQDESLQAHHTRAISYPGVS